MHNKGKITRHHLIPKERKKNKSQNKSQVNINFDTVLKLWREKHNHWHFLFKNMTLDEIIELLQRIKRIKSKPVSMKSRHSKAA